MPTIKSTCECRQRARARTEAVGKLKTSVKDAAGGNKVAEISVTLIKIKDNRRAYTINIKVISQRKTKKLRALVDLSAQRSIYVDTATA
jgi:5-hydroxyisourate hydrolase-like protein (transthyretin family)